MGGVIDIGNRVLSIEIGSEQTKILEISEQNGTRKIFRSAIFETPRDTVEDGTIKDKVNYGNKLREAIQSTGFETNRVIFTILSSKIYTKEIIIPYVPKQKIKDIINTNITEYLPFSIQGYIINHTVIEQIKEENAKKYRIMLVAIPEAMVKSYYMLAEMLRLEVVSLDYTGNSVYQVLRGISDKSANVYIQLNEKSSLITILKDKNLVLQRTVAYGTKEIVASLMEHHYPVIKDERQAFNLLVQQDYITSDVADHKGQDEFMYATASEDGMSVYRTVEAVSETVTYLVSSIGRVIDYYVNRGGGAIQKIYIFGQGSKIRGIRECMQKELGILPQIIEEVHKFKPGKEVGIFRDKPNEFIDCIGAVIAPVGFQLNETFVLKQKRSNVIETSVICGVCLTASLVFFLIGSLDYKSAKNKLSNAQNTYAAMPEPEHTQTELDSITSDYSKINTLDKKTFSYAEATATYLDRLEQCIVKTAEISSMSVNNDTIDMSVVVPNKKTAAKLILELRTCEIPSLETTISNLTETQDENGVTTVNFSISLNFIDLEFDNAEEGASE